MSIPNKENVPPIKMGTNKKPVIRKPPVVKQTLTSIYRTLKANPLLLSNNSKYNQSRDFDVNTVKIPNAIRPTTFGSEESNLSKVFKQPVTHKFLHKKDTTIRDKPILKKSSNVAGVNKIPASKSNTDKILAKPSNRIASKFVAPQKGGYNVGKTTTTTKQVTIKRRSLSAEHFDRKKTNKQNPANRFTGKSETILSDISPIIVNKNVHRVTFQNSPHNRKRSLSCSATPSRKTMYSNMASTPKPVQSDLHQRLEKWLQKHRKPIEKYHHLQCFGFKNLKPKINNDDDDENKENIEVECASTSSSYENLNISKNNSKIPNIVVDTPITYSCRSSSDADMRHLAQGALKDLHALILDGYSNEQCEAWLGMIRQKYGGLEEEPQYWECRAAIEQTRGNITSAVDCLRSAIVHGAEVKSVDQCLEQLLEKFSLLNITNESKNTKSTDPSKKDRTRILCDARNIFKSTIIQFAIQERKLKKKKPLQEHKAEKKFVATPVRRSTRRRTTLHVSTPGVKLCSTLHELEPNIRDCLSFEKNSALSVK